MNEYGWGVVDKDGKPWEEGYQFCVTNQFHAQSQAARLSENVINPRSPFKAVRLCFETTSAGEQ